MNKESVLKSLNTCTYVVTLQQFIILQFTEIITISHVFYMTTSWNIIVKKIDI